MRTVFFFSFLAAASASLGASISINDSSGATQNPVRSSSGAVLPTGSALVRVGFFSDFATSDTALLSSLANNDKSVVYSTLSSRFVPLAEGRDTDLGNFSTATSGFRLANRTVDGLTNTPGRLAGQAINVTPTAGTPNSYNASNITGVPANTRLFILVYDGLTPEASNGLAIFGADTWLMPSDSLASLQLNTIDINVPAEILRGSQGSIRLADFTPVPEPGVSLLALASLGLLARRRR